MCVGGLGILIRISQVEWHGSDLNTSSLDLKSPSPSSMSAHKPASEDYPTEAAIVCVASEKERQGLLFKTHQGHEGRGSRSREPAGDLSECEGLCFSYRL